ncbi:sulfatase-like hydrolase/transferase [Parafilimonas sp.]|uniref:sulfatase-like hydrolase/transferase n=1 Tax=Parafilimonas sp. TaxID=1969739 RepID=UPI0039E554F3
MKKSFLYIWMMLFASFLHAQRKMNVVFILSDDQTWNTIHALGNAHIITPGLDRLVKMGTSFTRAHVMGGRQGAICMPSRVMILTGRYENRLQKDGAVIPVETPTFPELLRAKGYITYQSGKWHSDKASYNRSFSTGDNIFFGGMNFPDSGGQEKPQMFHYDPTGRYPYSAKWQGNGFSSAYYAAAAVNFINKQKNSDTPFVCYLAFTSPHDPRTAPERFRKMYDPGKIPLPPSFMPQHPFDNGELQVRDELLLPKPLNKDSIKKEIAEYYAMITEMDSHVGEVLDALEANGMMDNTLIVFAGDNGLAVGNHGLLGKQNLYDPSVRVPLIIAGPGLPKNKRSDALCYLSDIGPTVLDFTGTAIPASVESKSLLPVIKNNAPLRDHIYFLYRDLMRGIRTSDNWKLLLYNVNGVHTTQLFNLNKDPYELHNLAGDKQYSHKVQALTALLQKDMGDAGDDLDISKPGWKKE